MKNCIYLTLVLLIAFSCTEPMEIETREGFTRLIVEGSVSTDTMRHTVLLSATEGYFSDQAVPPVTGAAVTISDGISDFILKETSPGKYKTSGGVYGVPGRRYRLNIRLAQPVGGFSEYTAVSELLRPVVLDSVSVKFYPDWDEKGMWEVKGFFLDSPYPDYYRFMLYRNGKPVTGSLSDWYVTDDLFFNGKYLRGTTLGWLHQHQEGEALQAGDTLTAEVQAVQKDFAEFLWGMRSSLYGSNPLFSGPPANVKGNISNGAIGFFAAYPVSRAKVVIKP